MNELIFFIHIAAMISFIILALRIGKKLLLQSLLFKSFSATFL